LIQDKQNSNTPPNKTLGFILIQASALLFFLASVPIRLAKQNFQAYPEIYSERHPGEFTFYRFFIGFIFFSVLVLKSPEKIKPNKIHFLIARALFNFSSLTLMFYTVDYISASTGSILNMTFPLFVAIISFFFLDKKLDYIGYVSSLVAVVGIILTMPTTVSYSGLSTELSTGYGIGLLSGFTGALAIIFLGFARKYNSTETVLFYMFFGGLIFSFIAFREHINFNIDKSIIYLLSSAIFGVVAQYALTHSFKYISTVEVSVTSTTRIIYAALLGGILAKDPSFSLTNWIGIILIFLSSTYLAFNNSKT